jgi:DNA-damage-inducible protein J
MSSLRNDAASARRIVTYHVCDTLSPTWSDTMPKNAYITARVDKSLKAKAEKVLGRVGITTTDAITMLLHQIVLRKGLPFEARIPNKDMIAAMAELDRGGGESFGGTAEELFETVVGSQKRRRT